jgi:serine/threonine protein kinase
VIHSDLRPENFLVHATTPTSLDLLLCDFGGSTCLKLGLDGGHLPDYGFLDPNAGFESTEQTDIFSLASVFYTILTGHWPYRGLGGRFRNSEEMIHYEQLVTGLFGQRKFPEVDGLFGGAIITKCWLNEYTTAEEVVKALKLEMRESGAEESESQFSKT